MSLLFLDIALSLIVVFVMLSVFCSSLLEWYSQKVGARAEFLRKGLLHMLGDDGLYRQVINHPLIEALGRGSSRGLGPAYIPSAVFADALLDSVVDRAVTAKTGSTKMDMTALTIDGLRDQLKELDDHNFSIATALAPIVRRTENLDQVRQDVAKWYEAQADRVTGWYKAFARMHLFILGLVVAFAFNINVIAITKRVAEEPGLRNLLIGYAADPYFKALANSEPAAGEADTGDHLVVSAKKAKDALDQAGLPFGWNDRQWEMIKQASWIERGLILVGWLLTGLGISLGAPFWFELLNKVASLRAAGPKPSTVDERKT
ncbi:MAG: hypothetical protein QM706_20800 [Nitrospira sp.]